MATQPTLLATIISDMETQIDTVSGAILFAVVGDLSEHLGPDLHQAVCVGPPFEMEEIFTERDRSQRWYDITLTVQWAYGLDLNPSDQKTTRTAALAFGNSITDALTSSSWARSRRCFMTSQTIEKVGQFLVGTQVYTHRFAQVAA